jgi:anaerobic magnesium-protoporphyrin IX monomethyl ester cyclase
MKILAVAPRTGLFPIGLAYVVAAMKRAGYEVDCANLELDPSFTVPHGRYDVVATSGLACHFQDVRRIAVEAKAAGARVVAGGGLITADLEFMREHIPADCFVTGEGEHAIIEILRAIERGEAPPAVVKSSPINDLDALPFPDYDAFGYAALLEKVKGSDAFFTDIVDEPRFYPVIASRSCPFRCTFCYSPLGNKYRQRSIRSVLDELRVVIPRHRINIVQVMDELFSYDEARVREFVDGLAEIAKGVPWEIKWGCSLRVDGLEDGMLDLLQASSCCWIQYGFESFSPAVLRSMKKKIKPEQIARAVRATLDRKIALQANFIFGDPAETPQTVEETLSFWRRFPDAGISLLHVLPLPDSELYRRCLADGTIPDKLAFYQRGLFERRNMTSMSDDEFHQSACQITRTFLRHVPRAVPSSVSGRHMTATCPHCRATTTYQNFSVTSGGSHDWLLPARASLRFFFRAVYCRECRRMYMAVSRPAKAWLELVKLIYTPAVTRFIRWAVRTKQRLLAARLPKTDTAQAA